MRMVATHLMTPPKRKTDGWIFLREYPSIRFYFNYLCLTIFELYVNLITPELAEIQSPKNSVNNSSNKKASYSSPKPSKRTTEDHAKKWKSGLRKHLGISIFNKGCYENYAQKKNNHHWPKQCGNPGGSSCRNPFSEWPI